MNKQEYKDKWMQEMVNESEYGQIPRSVDIYGNPAPMKTRILERIEEAKGNGILLGHIGRFYRSKHKPVILKELHELGLIEVLKKGHRTYFVASEFTKEFKDKNPYFSIVR